MEKRKIRSIRILKISNKKISSFSDQNSCDDVSRLTFYKNSEVISFLQECGLSDSYKKSITFAQIVIQILIRKAPDFTYFCTILNIQFIYSEKVTKFSKSSPYFYALHRTKVRGRFRKILWPSQNIWTLNIWMRELNAMAS